MIKCENCGGFFNERFLASHQRLAHRKKPAISTEPESESEVVDKVLTLVKRLPAKAREIIIKRLTATRDD